MCLIPSHPLCFLLFVHTYFYSTLIHFLVWYGGEECGEEMLVGKKRRAVVKCGREEVWMTTAIDLKSPLEYFFWASLSYEPLSYEPNISVWVSF